MPVYPFMQVDAFTDQPLGGNPCAILFDCDELDSKKMLAIARENNLSETAFVRSSEIADFAVRYFTPASEIPFAGHPTLATACALYDSQRIAITGEISHLTLELQVGLIPIDIYSRQGKILRIEMTQNKPVFLQTYDPSRVMPAFGLNAEDLLPTAAIQTVSTGTPQLMIPLTGLDALRKVQINLDKFQELRRQGDFFSPHLFCLEGATPLGRTFARHLDIPPDVPEDPFTGSATGGMAAYLWRYNLIELPNFIAEQGHWMNRPGQAWVEVVGPREDIQAIKVGGQAVTVLRGSLYL